jgi:hypothetical protein
MVVANNGGLPRVRSAGEFQGMAGIVVLFVVAAVLIALVIAGKTGRAGPPSTGHFVLRFIAALFVIVVVAALLLFGGFTIMLTMMSGGGCINC